jgi:hypothetical protein
LPNIARAKSFFVGLIVNNARCRYYYKMSSKIYGIIRIGTVLGDGMPRETAANIFTKKDCKGNLSLHISVVSTD